MYDTAVIIPHYNDVARLKRCLDALMPQVDEDIEVVVADNGSTQSLELVFDAWPSVRLVNQPQIGAGPARNAGVAATSARWILFLDADCVPAPDWVATARRLAEPGVIWGGPVDLFDETPLPRSGAEAFETVFAFQVDRYLRDKAFLPSCQLVLERSLFEDVGGFLADISEDVEWCHRAVASGYRLDTSSELRISHPTRSDWDALARKWKRITAEGFYESRGSLKARALWVIKALAMPLSAVVHTPSILASDRLTVSEKGWALATLVQLRFARLIWMIEQVLTGKAGKTRL